MNTIKLNPKVEAVFVVKSKIPEIDEWLKGEPLDEYELRDSTDECTNDCFDYRTETYYPVGTWILKIGNKFVGFTDEEFKSIEQ